MAKDLTTDQSMIVVMYHALYETEQALADIPEEERPYAISTENFKHQLDLIAAQNLYVVNPLQSGFKPGIVLTFDDGHKSFYEHAYPILKNKGYSAIFFITPNLIASREDFCSWEQLREMAENGMSIESHGLTHKFLNDLSDHEAVTELGESKSIIEQHCKNQVTSISFPGGRFKKRTLELAKYKNYSYCFSSITGMMNQANLDSANIQLQQDPTTVKRVALKQNTTLPEFKQIITGKKSWYLKTKALELKKASVKKLLGNKLYHLAYSIAAKR